MTKLQAETSIEFLKNIWSDCEFDNGALRYAVEALEMQIPETPIVTEIPETKWASSFTIYSCPACGDKNIYKFDLHKYCPNCGKAILWDGVI